MRKKSFLFIAFLLAIAQGAWAQFSGSGTSADPYLIEDGQDWQMMSNMVQLRNSVYGDKYYRLTQDIILIANSAVSVGTESAPFSGHFDGGDHTLTLYLSSESEACAPFAYVCGAEISSLNTTGEITTSERYAGSIVGIAVGKSTESKTVTVLTNCVSNTVIHCQRSGGDDCPGGLVGAVYSWGGLTLDNCVFSGQIIIDDTTGGSGAGLVGWSNEDVTLNFCKVFPDPGKTTNIPNGATFVRMADGKTLTANNCYYTQDFGGNQGSFVFSEVNVPTGCTAEFLGDPKTTYNGVGYYTTGVQVRLSIPEGTTFDHWKTSGSPVGCFINDPWTAEGIHTLSDVRCTPTLTIETSMPEPYQSNRTRYGVIYRYLTQNDYLLFMSDSVRQARNYQFDSDGECYVVDGEGTTNYVTVVWGCNPTDDEFQNYYRDGWFFEEKNYEGSFITNDIVSTVWDHTMLHAIAPRAFQGVSKLKRIIFLSDADQTWVSNATAPLYVNIQEEAFKNSGIEEVVMMYRNEKTSSWDVLGPSGHYIAANAFDGTDCQISVDPSVYQDYLSDKSWKPLYNRLSIYAAKIADMNVNGATYSYWRDNQGEALKNDDAGHESLLSVIRYWNADYQQFNATSLLTNSSENVWYTQVIGVDAGSLDNGTMRIYNDPGSYYNYKTIAINSLGQSKDVKYIEFWQTNGRSENSYSDPKIVIRNNAFKGCDNLKELRMFYYVQDGDDRWVALGPKDVIPGTNIFGLKEYTDEEIRNSLANETALYSDDDPKVPEDFKILVSPELYPEFLDDPNWQPYLGFIEPVDYSPSTKSDIEKDGLTYGFMTNPGGILQSSQTVSQDVSWWTAPRIAIEVALWAYSIYKLATIPSEAAYQSLLAARDAACDNLSHAGSALTTAQNMLDKFTGANAALLAATGKKATTANLIAALTELDGLATSKLFMTEAWVTSLADFGVIENGALFLGEDFLARQNPIMIIGMSEAFKSVLKRAIAEQAALVATKTTTYNSLKATASAVVMAHAKSSIARILNPTLAARFGAAATATSGAGLISSACWGGSGSYNADLMQKGMRNNIIANMHQVGLVGGGYVITTPSKNVLYHTYVKSVDDRENVTIYAGFDDDNNSNTSDRTMTFAPKAFRDHKNLKTVSFHSMEGQTSNAGLPMLMTIPDSAFVGCDNLVELNLLLKDNEGGTRALGPENFILAGDSIFAGLDSLTFHIVIDESRKQDFLDNESWAPLAKYFTYQDAKPKYQYSEYGGDYAYSYENNSIQRVHKVSGHKIEHTEVVSATNTFLAEHQGALKLCNDIGEWNNFQLDAVRRKAFYGNNNLRVINFTDLYGAGAYGTCYTDLEMTLQDSCFANCQNLVNLDMLYLVTDGTNHIDPIKPSQVKIGQGVLAGTNAIIKMMPQQVEWFEADSAWTAYKDRFVPCIIQPTDDGIKAALKPMAYYDMAHTGNDWTTWPDYIDLARIQGAGFSWLDGKFREKSDDIRSFPDFKHFASVGLDYVGKEWFRGCRKMTNIFLPSTIKTIDDYAFASCSSLQEIELPEAVEKINAAAFADCTDLKTIVVRGTTPATLGDNAFQKNEGLKIYVPQESLNDYLTAWAEYRDYIVSDATYKINKVVTVNTAGTLADELGLSVEWSYSGIYAGDEPRYLHGNYSKYDSLTVSGPLNDLDLWVIRYLAGNNGYNRGGVATDGCLKYLNLYNASIVKDDDCKAHYLNFSIFINNLWRDISEDNELPIQLFHGCTALEDVVLPKTLTTIITGIFEECPNLKRVAMTGALTQYDGHAWKIYQMLDYPLEELVLLTDGHATSDANDPWGYNIGEVYTTKARISDYLNDPCITSKTSTISAPFEDDDVWNKLMESGEFFPSVFTQKEDVGTMFSETDKAQNTLKYFDEFQYFTNVKELNGTFAGDNLLERVTLPGSVERIAASTFAGCSNLKAITISRDSVPELEADAFKDLPSDFVIYVPRDVVKVYRTKWEQYADHINPASTQAGTDEILTVTVTEPNTLAEKLGLEAIISTKVLMSGLPFLVGVRGDYSKITKLKVVGPISGGDLSLLRYLSGFCAWSNTRNYAGRLEYIDLYDAELKESDIFMAQDVVTFRDTHVEDNVLPAYSFLQSYNLKTLILPRTCKEVRSRALQQCEYLETLVLGDDLETFNWNALDDDASLTRMYILAQNKVNITTENTVWQWLCNNYNPTFDAFYVRPSQYQNYLYDDAYTGSSWQRTNNVSTGVFDDDDAFCAFASHGAATADELMDIISVEGWFDSHPGAKDLTQLQFTAIDSLSKATIAPLTKLEKIALPLTLTGMEDDLFKNATNLRYVDMLMCDSTNIMASVKTRGLAALGIDSLQTLVYVPSTYGAAEGTNIVVFNGANFNAETFRLVDGKDYCVPYAFTADKVENTRTLAGKGKAFAAFLPYDVTLDATMAKAYVPTGREGSVVTFTEVSGGEMEALKPYVVRLVAKKATPFGTDEACTIPASTGALVTSANEWQAIGYTMRGTVNRIDNATAAEMGILTLTAAGEWQTVPSDNESAYIAPFRAYMLESTGTAGARVLTMRFSDDETTGVDTLRLIDSDGTERYYDLNGRELSGKPEHGIYIHNGQKHIAK